ncbi:MAG TPA: DUF1566 domain-containing protein [Azoarcus taiwanensis]|nr:DUF1566 domain-containing protein [Azoarcus taiwanensis]
MTAITLESIREQHDKLGKQIAALEAIAGQRTIHICAENIQLNPGEHYAGILLGDDGTPNHHVILMAGEATDINWYDAKKWAADNGGELPTRAEQALLYANLKIQFTGTWHWSDTPHESDEAYAWCQVFSHGNQYDYSRHDQLRARAVRRLIIQ